MVLNKLTNEIYNIPKNITNILTHQINKEFDINTTSLLPNYLYCNRQQFIQALNDPRQLETICQILTKHIIAKYGGSLQLHFITKINTLKIPKQHTKHFMKNIHQNAIEHLTNLILNERKLDNKQAPMCPS